MAEKPPNIEPEENPVIEEAVEIAAEKRRKEFGTPAEQTLREAEESAIQKEDTLLKRTIRNIRKRLFGN